MDSERPAAKGPRGTRVSRLEREEYVALRSELQAAMHRQGIKQRELSRKAGMSFAFTHKVLNGLRTLELTEFLDICEHLDLDPADVIRAMRNATEIV